MAKASTDARAYVGLKCPECGFMIRNTSKNTKEHPDKMEKMKYCPKCQKHQLFKETKVGK